MDSNQVEMIEGIIGALQKKHQIPGLTIAVVKDGEVVITKGYGHTHLQGDTQGAAVQGQQGVDEHTKFNIASITKGFTAVLLANILQHRKDITWDTPLVEILGPSFSFAEKFRTERACLRDLLGHKMGIELGETDFGWLCESIKRKDLLHKASHLPTVGDFRTRLMYNNYMYTLAGLVAEQLTDTPWEALVEENIFQLLGMEDSSFIDRADESWEGKVALPHVGVNGIPEPLSLDVHKSARCIGPAATICSSACDMAKWMMFLLNNGAIGDIPVINKTFLQECWRPQFVLPTGTPYWSGFASRPTFPVTESRKAYGFGFYLGSYRGFDYVSHAGELFGYDSLMTLYHDLGLGIFTATNGPAGRTAFISHQLLHYFVADLMFGETPWLDTQTVVSFPEPWQPKEQFVFPPLQVQTEICKNLPPSRPLPDYAGTYSHGFLGKVSINVDIQKNVLYMLHGRIGKFFLHPDGEEDEFRMEGHGVLNFVHRVDMFAPSDWMMVKFTSKDVQGRDTVDGFICSLFESGPLFKRHL